MKVILKIGFLSLTVFPTLVAGQDLLVGFQAAELGDYETAMANWMPLAEQGNPEAQNQIGMVYRAGVAPFEQSNERALYWFQLSAKQGFGASQGMLGYMYFLGQGVPKDFETAYMWTNLSASIEWRSSYVPQEALADARLGILQLRSNLAMQMTADLIMQAQRPARVCVSSRYVSCD